MVKAIRNVVNGHSRKIMWAAGLGLTGLLVADVHNATKDAPALKQQIDDHEKIPIHPGAATTLSEMRDDLKRSTDSLTTALKDQREDAQEWRSRQDRAWDKQEKVNDAMVLTLEVIRDKLPDRKP